MSQLRYIDRSQFKKIAAEGDGMGFNRQVDRRVLKKLPDGVMFSVEPLILHEHIAFKTVDPHLRTRICFRKKSGKRGWAFVDMKLDTFAQLSTAVDFADGVEVVSPEEMTFAVIA